MCSCSKERTIASMMSVSGQTRQYCSLWGLSTDTSAARLQGMRTGWTLKTYPLSASEPVGVPSTDSFFLVETKCQEASRE